MGKGGHEWRSDDGGTHSDGVDVFVCLAKGDWRLYQRQNAAMVKIRQMIVQ